MFNKNVYWVMMLIMCGSAFGYWDSGTENLWAYWDFSADATDNHTGTHNGSVGGAVHNTTEYVIEQGSYTFNGTTDYISVSGGLFSGWTNFSVSVWLYPHTVDAQDRPVGHYQTAGGDYNFITYFDSSSNELFVGFNNGSSLCYGNTGSITLSQWTHVVFTWNGTDIYTYQNGTEVNHTTGCGGVLKTVFGAVLTFGRGSVYYYDGNLDEVGIWNRTLSPADVSTLFSRLPYPFVPVPSVSGMELLTNYSGTNETTLRIQNTLIIPFEDNNTDLGYNDTFRFRNIFFSGLLCFNTSLCYTLDQLDDESNNTWWPIKEEDFVNNSNVLELNWTTVNQSIDERTRNITGIASSNHSIYAQLSDLTDQTFAMANTKQAINLSTEDEIYGLTHTTGTNNSQITIVTPGTYTILAQPQVAASPGQSGTFHMWLEKNIGSGFINVSNSNVELSLSSSEEDVIPLIIATTLQQNDIIRIVGSVSNTGIFLDTQTPTGEPAIPSIIFSMILTGAINYTDTTYTAQYPWFILTGTVLSFNYSQLSSWGYNKTEADEFVNISELDNATVARTDVQNNFTVSQDFDSNVTIEDTLDVNVIEVDGIISRNDEDLNLTFDVDDPGIAQIWMLNNGDGDMEWRFFSPVGGSQVYADEFIAGHEITTPWIDNSGDIQINMPLGVDTTLLITNSLGGEATVTIDGGLEVDENASVLQNVVIGGNLEVDGKTNINQTLYVNGSITANGIINTTTNLYAEDLFVSDDGVISDRFSVGGLLSANDEFAGSRQTLCFWDGKFSADGYLNSNVVACSGTVCFKTLYGGSIRGLNVLVTGVCPGLCNPSIISVQVNGGPNLLNVTVIGSSITSELTDSASRFVYTFFSGDTLAVYYDEPAFSPLTSVVISACVEVQYDT